MSVEELYPVDRVKHSPFLYYPNVNTDTDAVTPESARRFADALSAPASAGRKAALYVHVPFCKNHCTFCFYNIDVVKRTDPTMRRYVDSLLREMRAFAESAYVQGLTIENVFIGGGTPSMLPDDALRDVLIALRRHFDLSGVLDFTIEMHLETMTASNLEICRELGVNRVSFGWQTSIPRLRKLLAVLPSEETLHEVVRHLQRLDFPLVWDLMYALPGQTDEEWEEDLRRSIEFGVACIDIHRCDIVPPAPLYDLVRAGKIAGLATPQQQLDQYRIAHRVLLEQGYAFNTFGQFNRPDVPKAVSHHGRNMYRSSHDLLALGPGAIGVVADSAYMNARDLGDYALRTERDGRATACVCAIADETWQERDFVLGLGQLWSVPKSLLRGPLSDHQEQVVERLVAHGALEETADEYRLTDGAVGYHFSIAHEFVPRHQVGRNVGYLRAIRAEVDRRRRRQRPGEASSAADR
ncbi:MAG TPA: radical SAM protein [Candidatus Binatia bacterium]|nr:radical SAM protein [Candidatus Binatia bacterium]